jgi:uroporphyrinogen III methyltransferase/synthase
VSGKQGVASWVGVGPGAPDLITVRGQQMIQWADRLYLHADLAAEWRSRVAPNIPVQEVDDEAKWMSEAELAYLRGERIVRLVPGDPLIDPAVRAEWERWSAKGLIFEVIPGISREWSDLTHAGIFPTPPDSTEATAWMVMNEQVVKRTAPSQLDGIRDDLQRNGWLPGTPTAWIQQGGRAEQKVLLETLATLSPAGKGADAGTLVIGEGVRSRERLAWFERQPLFGCRILVTRAREQAGTLSDKIRSLGGEAVAFPAIEIHPPAHGEKLDEALSRLEKMDWVVFTSVNGVTAFFRRLQERRMDIRRLHRARVAAIGAKTAAELESRGIRVDCLPEEFRAEALVEAIRPLVRPGETILCPRANIARSLLVEELTRMGCDVIDAHAYDTRPASHGVKSLLTLLREGRIHVITFTSSSTVRYFMQALEREAENPLWLMKKTRIACIGPITADTAVQMGMHVAVTAETYTIDGLVEALIRWRRNHNETI